MRIPETYKCDHPGCEAVKGKTNHWYAVTVPSSGQLTVLTWELASREGLIIPNEHYCGADHALQAVSRWLSGRAQA